MNLDERAEEALESLWEELEEGRTTGHISAEALSDLARRGLTEGEGPARRFTEAGRAAATRVIRRHRLAERLFLDVVEAGRGEMEAAACQMEHALRPGVEEKVCELLGHPEACPHGRPIPPGPCCLRARQAGERFVAPLAHLKPGEDGLVAYLKTRDNKKVQKLMAMGVLPGTQIRLDRAFPSFVFTVGYSQYAVDAEMASLIYVRRRQG